MPKSDLEKSPLARALQAKRKAKQNRGVKVIATNTKVTTVFDPNHSGYNSLDSLDVCPICLVTNTRAVIRTVDGREIPVAYCLRHRSCLPLPLGDTK